MKKQVGIREFKSHLSSYLRRVKRGESVLLTDRGEVVAELIPTRGEAGRDGATAYAEAVARGEITPAVRGKPWPFRGWKGVGLKRGESQAILDELREERLK